VLENNGSSTTTYSYNEQNRLIDAITTRGFVTEKIWYEYGGNENALVKVKETTKPVDPDMAGSFAFAKAGITTTREVAFMEYNVWNQMVRTIDGDKALTYQYNGEGYRVEKKVNDEITRYMYEADKVILEVDGQGNETARNIYGSNLLMRKEYEK
jgi:YD repeat-containing protein